VTDEGSMRVAAAVLEEMVAHARREAPNECCGLLVGTAEEIGRSVPTPNLAASPTRYEVDPREHIALNRQLRGSGTAVIGVYHSHPRTSAEPSPSDIREAFYPDFVYVIVSLADPRQPDVRAFRIRDGQSSVVSLRSFQTSW
jgi:[CysO sulfur-carrier protein]-S-L-cysteine hydrolase